MTQAVCLPINTFFNKMVDAHNFEQTNGKLPAYIAAIVNDKEYHIPPLGDGGYLDGLNRVAAWLSEKQDYPECINLQALDDPGQVVIPVPTDTGGWDLTGLFTKDNQDNSVNCGPSSLLMTLSALGYTTTEAKLAQLAGTSASGTDHAGLFKAAKSVAPNLNYAEYTLKYLGFQGIANHIKAGCEIILHHKTGTLTKDADGNVCWVNDYGHYLFVEGINMTKKLVKVYDPTKSERNFTFDQMQEAMLRVTWDESILAFCKA